MWSGQQERECVWSWHQTSSHTTIELKAALQFGGRNVLTPQQQGQFMSSGGFRQDPCCQLWSSRPMNHKETSIHLLMKMSYNNRWNRLPEIKFSNFNFLQISSQVTIKQLWLIVSITFEAEIPKVHWFQLLKCEYFLVSLVLYYRKLNIWGFWTFNFDQNRHSIAKPN